MEIRHLKLVKAVAEEGSLTRATKRLFLSQSALSHQLKELETQLGTPVFHRINKKLVLTDAGKVVLNSANVILCELEKASKEVKRRTLGEFGKLSICTECYTCYHWLPPLMKRFQLDYPNVEIELNTDNTRRPLEQLLKGKLDVAIVHRMVEDSNIHYQPLFQDELVAMTAPDHPWTGQDYVQAEDFKTQTLITHHRSYKQSSFYERFLQPAGVKPRKVLYLQITEAIVEMVKAGMGVAIMARWAMQPYLLQRQIALHHLTAEGLCRQWYVATLQKEGSPGYLTDFLELLQTQIRR